VELLWLNANAGSSNRISTISNTLVRFIIGLLADEIRPDHTIGPLNLLCENRG